MQTEKARRWKKRFQKETIEETQRRRGIQEAYNKAHGIVPKTIIKAIGNILEHPDGQKDGPVVESGDAYLNEVRKQANLFNAKERKKLIDLLKKEMTEAAERLDYETAATYRDQIIEIEKQFGK